jgi:hypothetical protein
MWTLKLVTFVVSGTSTGGVGTTTAFLDFPSEAKCRAAADVLAGADRINASRGNHPNISPSRDHKVAMPKAGVGYQTALASQQWGLPMNLKLLTAVAIFATAPIVTFAQNGDPADQAPKPTLADAENVVQTISSDKTKLQAFCKLGKLPDQMQKAEDRNDTKGVDALVAKADPLAQQIGPEYLKIVEGLEHVDPSSAEGQRFAQ